MEFSGTEKIWLSPPFLTGTEQAFCSRAIDSGWLAPAGTFIAEFENGILNALKSSHEGHEEHEVFLGARANARANEVKKNLEKKSSNDCALAQSPKNASCPSCSSCDISSAPRFAVALSAGTAAIHLALKLLNVQAGDEVICQSFTFAASANPIVYCGATPIFVDSEPETWNLDPELVERAIVDRREKTGRVPAAIIAVHLYGMPAKMAEIRAVADKFGVPVIEDSAEALGSRYRGNACGTLGDFSIFSFNGNKIVTTSGGGMLICRNAELAARARFFATQAREPFPWYQHEQIGYNYRLSNVCAAIGCAQLESLDFRVRRRREIRDFYANAFAGTPEISVQRAANDDFFSNHWLTVIRIGGNEFCGNACENLGNGDNLVAGALHGNAKNLSIMRALSAAGIESRPAWKPLHMQPVFASCPFYAHANRVPVSEQIFANALCLPSGTQMTSVQLSRVAEIVLNCLRGNGKL